MKVLHLFSDQNWTGPAEPVLNLCKELERLGHDVLLAYTKPVRKTERTVATKVEQRGVRATDQFRLNRYFSARDNLHDLVSIPRFIRREGFDVVHCHLSHDHIFGAWATRWSRRPVVLVRTDHCRAAFSRGWLTRRLFRRWTDGVIAFSRATETQFVEGMGIPANRVLRIDPAIDATRYHPGAGSRALRAALGIEPDDVVVGIVARYQKHRKMDLFFAGFAQAVREAPRLKAMIVGHGEAMKETVHDRVRDLGLESHVVLAGYRMGQDYLDALASMDIFAFMVAGSDGTGRAMREAMAMGKPVVTNRAGMLAEFVTEGVDGFVFDNDPGQFADRLTRLAKDAELRARMGEAGVAKTRTTFALDRQGRAVEAFYRELLEARQAVASSRSAEGGQARGGGRVSGAT